jgi:CP family cyanate transporter-like MFS transporter
MRVTVLAVPPMIPLIHDDLQMTETQVGLLIALPLVTWAIAAVPGSLLIARIGVPLTLAVGLIVTGLAAAGRGAVTNLTAFLPLAACAITLTVLGLALSASRRR